MNNENLKVNYRMIFEQNSCILCWIRDEFLHYSQSILNIML
jgi:hypothetical protein